MEKLERMRHQNTKIVATVGPASDSHEKLLELVQAGVDVFRLNLSHGSHQQHEEVIKRVMDINDQYGEHIGILADLQGPKIRVGELPGKGIHLKEGDEIVFSSDGPFEGNKERIYIHYPDFATDVQEGEKILVDDGKIVFEVLTTDGAHDVRLKTRFGGTISSHKGVNLPDTEITLPSLTEKDLEDLDFLMSQPINWIALSFVRSEKDLIKLSDILEENDHPAKIIAKIEKPEAVENIDDIIKYVNGVMVARGDLGVEVPMEKLPAIQKEIISKCIQWARPVIVATQLMESMITNPSPTRAEITDVANAVLDGADSVMLSGETSIGKHPVRVVKAMNRILGEAEKHYTNAGKHPMASPKSSTFHSDVVCFNAARTAGEVDAKAIIGMTRSGYTAFKISSTRPQNEIYIFSDRMYMLATLNLVWGVRCFYYDKFTTTDETIEDVTSILIQEDLLQEGDVVVNTGTMPLHKRGRTNMLKVTVIE